MASSELDTNPYELLGLAIEATEGDIRTAYRKLSLKVHPDRNPNNPDAAHKFHELNQAYELLLDPLRRLAIDSSSRAKEARKARFAKYDAKRKNLQEELEERENAYKKQKLDKAKEAREREQENERIKEEGRRLREEKEKEAVKKDAELRMKEEETDEEDVPRFGSLDTTVKLKIPLASHPTLTTADSLSDLLKQFGATDRHSIVLSQKPPKKSPHKPPKYATALVPFTQIGAAFAAVCASGRPERGLLGIEVSWAGGSEPSILAWLRQKGRLDGFSGSDATSASTPVRSVSPEPAFSSRHDEATKPSLDLPKSLSTASFSSFPEVFPHKSQQTTMPEGSSVVGLDFEALTLMRLRQAERARLEKEIREQEANE